MAAAEKSRDENNREDWEERVIALRMERQHLTKPADLEEYNVLYLSLIHIFPPGSLFDR